MSDTKLTIYLRDLKKDNKIKVLNKIYSTFNNNSFIGGKGKTGYMTSKLINKTNHITKHIRQGGITYSSANWTANLSKGRVDKERMNKFVEEEGSLDFVPDEWGGLAYGNKNALGLHKNNSADYARRLGSNAALDDDGAEYDNNFVDNCEEQRDIDDELIKEINKKEPEGKTNQRNFFEESTDKLIFDELERKVFKSEQFLVRNEENHLPNNLRKMENKAITLQKFFRRRKLNQYFSNFQHKLFVGWDQSEENIFFIYADEMIGNKIFSIFVKIYSLDKMKFFHEIFLISELLETNEVSKAGFVSHLNKLIKKITEILKLKISEEAKDEEEYKFDDVLNEDENNANVGTFSVHERTESANTKRIVPEYPKHQTESSISSIKEVDYSNI